MVLGKLLEVHFEHFWALLPKWHPGSSLYRTCVAEVTFYRPCAPEECAWGAPVALPNSFARTCVVNTILACTLGLDSQLGALL